MYSNLEKSIEANRKKELKKARKGVKEVSTKHVEDLNHFYRRSIGKKKNFKNATELRSYVLEALEKNINKRFDGYLNQLNTVSSSKWSPNTLIITVVWKRSQTWGSNPTATAFIPGIGEITSGSIGGCGYDKLSTALARVLNQVPHVMNALYAEKNKRNKFKKSNHTALGYGSGYGVLPSFEGGVGSSSLEQVLKNIGFKVSTAGTSTTNTYVISK